MAGVTELGYLGVGVRDIDAWKQYSGDILGHAIARDSDQYTLYLRMDEYHHRLLVHPDGNDDVAYIGWQVPDAMTMQEVAAQVEAAGVKVAAGSREEADVRRVVDFVRFEDPNSGIPMEIFYGPQIVYSEFNARRPLSGFVTAEQGMGHIVIYTKTSADESIRFYRDVLGFRISDFVHLPGPEGNAMVFMHCNPRHHSLAFLPWADAPHRIQHLMMECNSINDVGTGYDIALEKGITSTSLGRHGNDWMFSFYMQNPSQWHCELGWNGRQIDDEGWQVQHYDVRDPGGWGHKGLAKVL